MDSYLIKDDNRTSSLSIKLIRFSLNYLPYCFDVEEEIPLSKANMINISYTPL
ncbi:hypothetical protein H8356DRAFT_1329769 [Neocallimastix lanati (nom. inval.)]|nr:hypothetical protein H8356DRAFT_1329769 [Neocallimastix sp. JGI-2020a]